MNVLSIAINNINGITAHMRVGMLAEFIRKNDFDIIFPHEVTSTDVLNITGYETYLNIGTFIRGTAIFAKCQHHLTNILTLPTGRAIAATFRGVRPIKIYAPSRTAQRAQREGFYNVELAHLLQNANTHIRLAGDFNRVQHSNDTTGHYHTSRTLTEIVPAWH
jgi:exonuclease III